MLGTNIKGKQLPNCLFCSHKVRITSKPRLYDPTVLTSHLNFTTYVRKFFSFIFISHTAILLLGNLFFKANCSVNLMNGGRKFEVLLYYYRKRVRGRIQVLEMIL